MTRLTPARLVAGHKVTTVYELTPVISGAERIAPLHQQKPDETAGTGFADKVAYLKIRYKLPDNDTSTEMVLSFCGD